MKIRLFAAVLIGFALAGCGGGSGGGTFPVMVSAAVIASGLDQPMQYVAHPSRKDLAYVLQREGKILALKGDGVQAAAVIDISGQLDLAGEGGALGMTFDPDFASNRYFYVYSIAGPPLESRVTRFTMNVDMKSASLTSAASVFAYDQTPYENHKGGSIHFGPDGMLYLALGDGGSGNDPDNRAQDPTKLFGKILRLDLSGDDLPADAKNNYRIPASNPWVGTAGVRGEIWGMGLRNPFRWTIDAKTGALIIADVGQNAYEEINYEPAGTGKRNYGWRVREGAHDSGNAGPAFSATLKDPFLEFDHSFGKSVIGGFIYRGSNLGSGMKNRYLFGDYISSRIWSVNIPMAGGEANPTTMGAATELTGSLIAALPSGINGVVSIDPDANGEPVVTELNSGRLLRLIPATL